jgi:dihydrofolate synthase/folylpolyglutamate synthase
MDYNEALNLIHSHSKLKYKPSLSRIGKAMSCFNNLQDSFKTIHITGTNGKGTVSELIKNALNFSGYKVGIFTSPFVEDFCERMRINDETIDKQILADYAKSTQKILEGKGIECNEFEFITIIALRWFYDEGCDYVILEVGLGGEFDPTNLVKKQL